MCFASIKGGFILHAPVDIPTVSSSDIHHHVFWRLRSSGLLVRGSTVRDGAFVRVTTISSVYTVCKFASHTRRGYGRTAYGRVFRCSLGVQGEQRVFFVFFFFCLSLLTVSCATAIGRYNGTSNATAADTTTYCSIGRRVCRALCHTRAMPVGSKVLL